MICFLDGFLLWESRTILRNGHKDRRKEKGSRRDSGKILETSDSDF